MNIGQRVRQIRTTLGLSQRELARRAGIHQETIQRLESGKQKDVTVTVAMRIARGLGVRIEDMLREVDIDLEGAGAMAVATV